MNKKLNLLREGDIARGREEKYLSQFNDSCEDDKLSIPRGCKNKSHYLFIKQGRTTRNFHCINNKKAL